MNNLYYQVDKDGNRFKFTLRLGMWAFLFDRHYRNVILKARQYGFTTFICILYLDEAIFIPNHKVGFIAHSKDDAKAIFQDKVRYAWDNFGDPGEGHPERELYLPYANQIKDAVGAKTESAMELRFGNKSWFRVSTGFRGGTPQRLHVSELGKIAAKYPDKAKEIQTGAFEAVSKDGQITVESTAEGQSGLFFDLCNSARNSMDQGNPLTPLDWQFHFNPWWWDPDYHLDEPQLVPVTEQMRDYFDDLETKELIETTPNQRAWYIKKRETLGDDVWREYPSTPDEAFKASLEGAYFSAEMRKARQDKRITKVPIQMESPVDTWWDLGMDDHTAIWFSQTIGREVHFIHYMEDRGEGLRYYVDRLAELRDEYGWFYGRHKLPHDVMVREMNGGLSRKDALESMGIKVEVAPRVQKKIDSIQAARSVLNMCWFDEARCEKGIICLDNYRKEWDERLAKFKDRPLHNDASHGADAFQVFATTHDFGRGGAPVRRVFTPNRSYGWT